MRRGEDALMLGKKLVRQMLEKTREKKKKKEEEKT